MAVEFPILSMRFSLLYTTARQYLIGEVVERWFASAGDAGGVEMLVVTDTPYHPAVSYPENVVFLVNPGRQDCVTGWNLAAAHAKGDVFIQVSDDLYPPKNWDASIAPSIRRFTAHRPDVVLNLLDERMQASCTFHPVLTRAAYDKLGYLYPSEFESMFCDNWFTAYHQKYSQFGVSRERFWNHMHRTTHKVTVDDVMRRHESPERYARGRAVLDKYIVEHAL